MARATLLSAATPTPIGGNQPWREVASLVRRLNRRAERACRSDRYVVDSPDLMCAVACGDRIIWANDKAIEALGYESPQALYGVPVWDWVAPECHEQAKRRMAQLRATQTHPRRLRYVLCGPNGKRLNVVVCTVDAWEKDGERCRHFVAGEEKGEVASVYLDRSYSLTITVGNTIQRLDGMTREEALQVLEIMQQTNTGTVGIIQPTSEATRIASLRSRSA